MSLSVSDVRMCTGFKFVLFSKKVVRPAALVLIHKRLECFFILELNPGILTIGRLSLHMNQCLSQTIFEFPDSTWFDGELFGHLERFTIRTFDWHGLEFVATPLDTEVLVFRGRPPERPLASVVWIDRTVWFGRTKVMNGIDLSWHSRSRSRNADLGRTVGGLLWPGPWRIFVDLNT
jgi:hypothetical protein